MSSELDRVFEELAKVLRHLALAAWGRSDTRSLGTGREALSVDLSLKVRDIDEFLASAQESPERAETEPLIDIIEDEERFKVLVLLPGIRKGDVSVQVSGDTVRVEVARGEDLYVKEIVCASPPDKASIVSAKENNSVVEFVFGKKEGRPGL